MKNKKPTVDQWRENLIKMYMDGIVKANSIFTVEVLNHAIRQLKAGVHPKKIEKWVTDLEKLWRKKL